MKPFQNLLSKLITVNLVAVALLSLSTRGNADTLFTIDYTTDGYNNSAGNQNIGHTFTVGPTDLLVTDLGAYVENNDSSTIGDVQTTTNDVTALLYNETTAALIGYVTIPTGTVADSQSFVYLPFTATLTSGDTYAVTKFDGDANAATPSTTYWLWPNSTSDVTTAGATLGSDAYISSNDPSVVPTIHNNSPFIGGNLKFSEADAVPEPSTWGMLLAGFTLLLCVSRRRLTA